MSFSSSVKHLLSSDINIGKYTENGQHNFSFAHDKTPPALITRKKIIT
jgi:hypothetical protein